MSEFSKIMEKGKLFIDTAMIEEISEVATWGILSGVTTNPKIIATQGVEMSPELVKKIVDIVPGPVSLEVPSNDYEEFVRLGKLYHSYSPEHVVIKVAMNQQGLKATKELAKFGIPTNITAVYTFDQAVLAGRAGGKFVSLFYNRIIDTKRDEFLTVQLSKTIADKAVILSILPSIKKDSELYLEADKKARDFANNDIRRTREFFDSHGIKSEIIVGSIRHYTDVSTAIEHGAHIVTVPTKFFTEMSFHPGTEKTIQEFNDAYAARNKK